MLSRKANTKKIALCAIFFWLLPVLVFADKIYLKDGKVYEGKLIGRSEKRFLFLVEVSSEHFRMSFFPEQVEKLELSKESVEQHIPFLKDVEAAKFEGEKDQSNVYELSLYGEHQTGVDERFVSGEAIKMSLGEAEREYYEKFTDILKKYADRNLRVQNIYQNLTSATPEDFAFAKTTLDNLYFELNKLTVPVLFKESQRLYLGSVKANYLAFNALDGGMLDEAAHQIKLAEEDKQRSMAIFREVVQQSVRALKARQEVPVGSGSHSDEVKNSQQ